MKELYLIYHFNKNYFGEAKRQNFVVVTRKELIQVTIDNLKKCTFKDSDVVDEHAVMFLFQHLPTVFWSYETLSIIDDNKFTQGVELIGNERREQIEKHGYDDKWDIENNGFQQLREAARWLIVTEYDGGTEETCPTGWNEELWDKMCNKSYIERLIIAGALLAAEIDRMFALEMPTGNKAE